MKRDFLTLTRFWVLFSFVSIVPANDIFAIADSAQKPNPVPLINQPVVPSTVPPGGGAFTLTVNGTGFARRSVVKWNGAERKTTFVSNHRLTAIIKASDIATANTASITVVNCGPGGGTSNVVYFPVTTPTSSLSFAQPLNFAAGQEMFAMLTGDFNEDGKTDVAMLDFEAYTVNIFLGNGDGSFQPRMDYATGARPRALATGDFNEDGHLDLVTHNAANVSILLGNGDGRFGTHVDFGPIPSEGSALTVADLDGDGHWDVVTADGYARSTISVLLGNGDGTLQPAAAYASGNDSEYPAAGDFNRDGKLDLAVTSDDANIYVEEIVSILIGNGDGTFQPPVAYDVGYLPFVVVTADFNQDGKLDLATANRGDNTVSILLGNGDGTFQPHVDYATGIYPIRIALADLNADGSLDLVVVAPGNGAEPTLSTLLGNGDGTFQPHIVQPVGPYPGNVVIADFNRDGKLDLGVDSQSNTLSILLQNTTMFKSPPQ